MKFTVIAAFGLLVLNLSTYAAPTKINAGKSASSPVIDGYLNDQAWESAPWHGPFFILGKEYQPEPSPTRFKILSDHNGVYLAFECPVDKISTKEWPRDGALWLNDCVEIFIVPYDKISQDPNIQEYYHFITNPSGSQYDSHVLAGVANPRWNTAWKCASSVNSDAWYSEVFIPYSAFLAKDMGNVWRINLGRKNGTAISTWMSMTLFKDLDSYAILDGLDFNPERFSIKANPLIFDIQLPDGRPTPFVHTKLEYIPTKTVNLNCAVYSDSRIIGFVSKPVSFPGDGKYSMSLPINISSSGNYRITMTVSDKDGVIFFQENDAWLEIAPIQLKMTRPSGRPVICSTGKDKFVSLSCSFLKPELHRLSATLQVINQEGKAVHREERKNLKSCEHFSFDTQSFQYGSYQIQLQLMEGQTLIGNVEQQLMLPAPTATETWINEKGQLMLNGEAVFPVGLMGFGKAHFEIAVQGGYNFIHSYTMHYQSIDAIISYLNDAHKHNLKVILYPTHLLGMNGHVDFKGVDGKRKQTLDEHDYIRMEKLVIALRNHPALLGWYLYDEPRSSIKKNELRKIYEMIKKIDPTHLAIGLDNSPRGCIENKDMADIQSLDQYPRPRHNGGNDVSILSIYNGIRQMKESLPPKGLWYTPQAFDYDNFLSKDKPRTTRAPFFDEIRCVTYLAIIAGASGIMPYKFGIPTARYYDRNPNAGLFTSPDTKIGFLEAIGPELKAMSAVLLADDYNGIISCDNPNIRFMAKQYHGKLFIFAANPLPKNIGNVNFHITNTLCEFKVLCESRKVKGNSGFSDNFSAYDVHIYTSDRDFVDPINIQKIKDRIASARNSN